MPSATDDRSEWRAIEVAPRYLRRNAARTMAGSVVRGLVELITNARDSAFRLLASGSLQPDGIPGIELEYSTIQSGSRISVRDRFEGMSSQVMSTKLLRYGETASGYESGEFVRGINARGAKDVAGLGPVKFESIHGNEYAECEIHSGLMRGPSSRPVTAADRERLRIPQGNGTVVTLVPEAGVSVPAFEALARDLDHHIEIRYRPAGQPAIPIILREIRERRIGREREIVGFAPTGEMLKDDQIALPEFAHYGATNGHLRLYRSEQPLAPLVGRAAMSRLWKSEAGIIVGDGRTAHDVTFFFARGSDDSAARQVFGELLLPQITGLLKEYERIDAARDGGAEVSFPELNPFQVTDPDRLGLNRDHPFVHAVDERVRPIVEECLRELQEELTPSAQERVGRELRDVLDRLGERLAERLDVPGVNHGTDPSQVRWGLSIVPPHVRLELGQSKRVSIYYRTEPDPECDAVSCTMQCESLALSLTAPSIQLAALAGNPGVFRGSLEVTGVALYDSAAVEVMVGDAIATLHVSVREPLDGIVQLDRDLQFSQRQYSALPGRRKKIEIFADPMLADREVEVRLAADAVGLSDSLVTLEFDPLRAVAVATLYADSDNPAVDRIAAQCTDISDEAHIVFRDFAVRPKIDFRFTDAIEHNGRRFRWDPEDPNVVLIAGGHPTVGRVLGPRNSSAGATWPGQNKPQTLAILAELIADAFVYRRLQDAAPLLGTETQNLVDPVDYENLRYQFFEEVYLLCHEALTPAYE